MVYQRQGRHKEAEALCVQVVGARKRVLGEDDVDTLHSMQNLARIYRRQGRHKEAETLLAQVVKAKKNVSHTRVTSSLQDVTIGMAATFL